MTNIDALDQAMTFIVDHPDKHDQRTWVCETGACLAGHVTLLNGYRAVSHYDGFVVEIDSMADLVVDKLVADAASPGRLRYAGARKVREVAVEILDLEDIDAEVLFGGANTIDQLQLMVKDLSNGELLRDLWVTIDHDAWGNPILERQGEPDA